jgi:hypothetical protein
MLAYLKKSLQLLMVLALVALFSSPGFAYPTLQLGIGNGTYDDPSDTIFAPGKIFTLYAFLIPNAKNLVGDTYYLSMAVSPAYGPSGGNLGSFLLNGNTIDVTADMTYGIPPLEETLATADPGDLAPHGIFPTYFAENSFTYILTPQTAKFNTQDHPTWGPQTGSGMYYQQFTVDTTNLAPGYVIHFDLYNSAIKGQSTDLDITQFAPFSHDAQSMPNTTPVPEPTSLLLLGVGMAAVGLYRRLS